MMLRNTSLAASFCGIKNMEAVRSPRLPHSWHQDVEAVCWLFASDNQAAAAQAHIRLSSYVPVTEIDLALSAQIL
jgi:hypothetical protein